MIKAIREAGCIPVQRDTFYEPVRVLDHDESVPPSGTERTSTMLEQNLATG